MRHTQTANQALRLAASAARPVGQQHICRACMVQAARQLHTSTRRDAEVPWSQKVKNLFFGSAEGRAAEESRENARKKRLQRQEAGEEVETLETLKDRKFRAFKTAAVVDSSTDSTYVPAHDWQGLETIGSEQWVKAQADKGEVFVG